MATVKITITLIDNGRMQINAEGPIKDEGGLVALLEEALVIARQAI